MMMMVFLLNYVLDYVSKKRRTDDVTFHIYIYVKKQTTLLFISTFMEKNRQRYFSYLHLWKKLLNIFLFFYVLTS